MDREKIFEVLKEAAVEVLGVSPEQIKPEARFKEDLGEVTTVGHAWDLVTSKVEANS